MGLSAPALVSHTTFASSVDRFEADGNAFGPADGTLDFVDEFDDGSLAHGARVSSLGFKYQPAPGAYGPVQGAQIKKTPNGVFQLKVMVSGTHGFVNLLPPNPGVQADTNFLVWAGPNIAGRPPTARSARTPPALPRAQRAGPRRLRPAAVFPLRSPRGGGARRRRVLERIPTPGRRRPEAGAPRPEDRHGKPRR